MLPGPGGRAIVGAMFSPTLPRSRLLLLLLGFCFLGLPVFGVDIDNDQKMYRSDAPEYEAIRTLYIEQGLALPFSSGPFSEAELKLALARLDRERLSEAGLELYRLTRSRFAESADYAEEAGRFAFDVGAELSLESYLHTDKENPFWEYRWEERRPILNLPLEAWVTKHAYGTMEVDLGKSIPDFSIYPTYKDNRRIDFETGEEDPFTNVPYNISTLRMQFPHRGFLSVGGDRWNLQAGRDYLDWGNGRTGNLYVSSYSGPHDYARLTTFWDNFKFTALWLSLDPHLIDAEREFEQYGYDTDGDGNIDYPSEGDPVYEPDTEQKSLLAHRFEVRLWDRLTLVATEGVVLGRESLELRHVNPFFVYHNLYANTLDAGNTHMSYEFDFAVMPGLSLYAAMSPDQWTSPLEPGTELKKEPNAIIYLAGIDYRRPLGPGYIKTTLEGVYSTKWMYIHNHPLTSITSRTYIQAEHGKDRTFVWIDKPLGHYGGNDFALLWLELSFQRPGRYLFGLNTYYEGDGENPINALLSSERDDRRPVMDEKAATEIAPSGDNPQWRAVATLFGEMEPWFLESFNQPGKSDLTLRSELSGQFMKNRFASITPYGATMPLEKDWQFDLQWVLSVTLGW